MKMSRPRALELMAASGDFVLDYCGPKATGEKFCKVGSPATLDECGLLTDASEWTYERIKVEPEWVLKKREGEFWNPGWYAGPKREWPTLETPIWGTRERAETYLKLLQEDWWDERT